MSCRKSSQEMVMGSPWEETMPRNKRELPKWANIYGSDPQPGDERFGPWPRETLLKMDADFIAALIVAIRSGRERAEAITATVRNRP